MSLSTPVVLIVFNRPETTRRVLQQIRTARPSRLFVVGDGPRESNPTDEENCKKVRDCVDRLVDWPCEVAVNYASTNMGCKRRVVSGLNWVFDHVEQAIILEDDCLPSESFFRFCDEILNEYKGNDRVMTVSGNNFQREIKRTKYSYYFSRYMHCWGWATWRRAWNLFDEDMTHWPQVRDDGWLQYLFDHAYAASYWRDKLEQAYQEQVDSWAYPWQFSIWIHSGLNVIPERNLVSNVGVGTEATHTQEARWYTDLQRHDLTFPIRHPDFMIRHKKADIFTQNNNYQDSLKSRIAGVIKYYMNA